MSYIERTSVSGPIPGLGQNAKNSTRADVFRCFSDSGHPRYRTGRFMEAEETPLQFHSFHYANHDASLFLDESRSGFLVLRVRILPTPHTTGEPYSGPGSVRRSSTRNRPLCC